MTEEYEVGLKITMNDSLFTKSLISSIFPDTRDVPGECRIILNNQDRIRIIISCRRINLLRALLNSYLSVISMLLHCLEVLENEPTKTPTRGPTDSD